MVANASINVPSNSIIEITKTTTNDTLFLEPGFVVPGLVSYPKHSNI